MAVNESLIQDIMRRRGDDDLFRTPGINPNEEIPTTPNNGQREGFFGRLRSQFEGGSSPRNPPTPETSDAPETTQSDVFADVPEGVTPDELAKAREAAAQRSGGLGENIGRVLLSLGTGGKGREMWQARDERFEREALQPLEDRAAYRKRKMEEELAQSAERRARSQERRAGSQERRKATEFETIQARQQAADDPDSNVSSFARQVLTPLLEDANIAEYFRETGQEFEDMSFTEISQLGIVPADILESIADRGFEREMFAAEITAEDALSERNFARERAAAAEQQTDELSPVDEAVQESNVENFLEARDFLQDAPEKIETINEMERLLDTVSTGPIAGSPLVSPILDLIEGADRSRFRQLSSELQLGATDRLSGVLSDSDMKLLRDSVANLSAEEDANLASLRQTRNLFKKGAARAKWMDQYYRQTGNVASPTDVPRIEETRVTQDGRSLVRFVDGTVVEI